MISTGTSVIMFLDVMQHNFVYFGVRVRNEGKPVFIIHNIVTYVAPDTLSFYLCCYTHIGVGDRGCHSFHCCQVLEASCFIKLAGFPYL